MQRYQIYLEPESVEIADDLARQLDLSRSSIIRDVVDRMMREYGKILAAYTRRRTTKNPILQMMGMAKTPARGVSENVDEIYLRD